ncbi:Yae1 family protein [Pseudomonas sp. NEEL19]|uniref:Yae1 family protein n=1 Tax=Pseudomonas sp. NEEL19 TaxID=2867409 RepID=UPI0023684D4C|nr:Yae1 family protein [Pseudomonas sp. NEEL19]WDM58751.1 Yae1 family protein [Pseudomonas sp. NEEL19]
MDHNWGAGRPGGGLDGGYTGSLDHAISNLHVGRSQGRKEGLEEGFDQGYAQGWDAGAACANEKLEPLRDHVRQYFQEAVELRTVVQRQKSIIDSMYEQMSKVADAAKNAHAQAAAVNPEAYAALQSNNELLQARVEVLDRYYAAVLEQSRLRQLQYERSLVFMRAAQALLEGLVASDSAEAQAIRQRFVKEYQDQVARSLRAGDIEVAPELDEAFGRQLPDTQRFIMALLQSATPGQGVD